MIIIIITIIIITIIVIIITTTIAGHARDQPALRGAEVPTVQVQQYN